ENDHKRILEQSKFTPGVMPPLEAVEAGKVAALTDEDRRTIVRWIDLGCPVDKTFDIKNPKDTGSGWLFDDQRPTLTLTIPEAGDRLLVGMHDYGSGIAPESFTVTADVPVAGVKPGDNLAPLFKEASQGVREARLP